MPIAARVAAKLIRILPDQLLVKVLRQARPMMREDGRVTAAANILRYVPKSLINEALDVLRNYPGGLLSAHALGTVALHVPSPLDRNALNISFLSSLLPPMEESQSGARS